ncbi:MAG: type I 3-dehydroquinate dehydratase, partial [Sedimentisphaerales bacterium]|nr:type I 3-dehydroquinate dehydratase [Sedimentisphaerales bacterium]
IAAKTVEQAKGLITAACAAGPQMLELRTDYLEELSIGAVETLIAEVRRHGLPMIVTCRDKKQGGQGDWPLQRRTEILTAAVKAGADYVDCEYENILIAEVEKKLMAVLAGSPCRLILSHHNFDRPFEDIQKLYDMIVTEYPAAIPKLVYTARHINDCFAAFDLLHNKEGDAIVFAMGEAGLVSRIIAKKLGSLVTFASLDEGSATAPGQLTIEQFKKQFRYDIINDTTQLFGVIADPVAHSISPAVHNACFADAGMNRLYLLLHVQGDKTGFDAFMKNIIARPWLDFRGFSVTLPHKMNAIEYVEQAGGFIEPVAIQIGAINTITIGINDRVSGYNTDCAGAMDAIASSMGNDASHEPRATSHNSGKMLKQKLLADVPVAVVGSGGVARAIVAGLADVGAVVTIYNRTLEKAHKLAHEFRVHAAPLAAMADMEANILINGTSIGMHPDVDETPVPKEYLKSDMIVFDTVYNPLETRLLKEAKEIGTKTISGAEMFINQAAEQFKLFTHSQPNMAVLRKVVFDCLGQE